MRVVETGPRRQGRTLLAIRIFLEAIFGALGIFLLAAVAAPRLFNLHTNLALLAAVLAWIACPVLGFLLAADVAAQIRRFRRGSRT
jgi:hypothetical protein